MQKSRRGKTERVLLLLFGLVAIWALITATQVPQHSPTYRGATTTTDVLVQFAPTPTPTPAPFPFPFPNMNPIPTFDPEQIIRDSVTTPSSNFFTSLSDWFNRETSIFTQTEATATYANDTVLKLWRVMLTIANAFLFLFLLFAGYEFFFASLTLRYTSILELVPRVLLAFLGANISLLFAKFGIELNNLLCRIVLAVSHNHFFPLLNLPALLATPLSLPALLLFLALCILAVFLALEVIAREGVLIVLTIFLPLLFLLLASRRTQRLGQIGIAAFLAATFLQFLQLTTMTAGTLMLLPFIQAHFTVTGTGLAPVSTLLGCLTLFWITLLLPRFFGNWMLSPIAESGQTLGYVTTYGAMRLLFM